MFNMGASRSPYVITTGPDGNLWFADYAGNKIGRVSGISIITVRLMHEGVLVNPYSVFHDAYTAAADGDDILAQVVDLTEILTLSRNIDVSFKGGYDSAFVLNTLMTTVKGGITVSGGKVPIDKIIIE